MKGLADALADPRRRRHRRRRDQRQRQRDPPSADSEIARWDVESKLVTDSTASDLPIGVPDPTLLRTRSTPTPTSACSTVSPRHHQMVDDHVGEGLYDDTGNVIWPRPSVPAGQLRSDCCGRVRRRA